MNQSICDKLEHLTGRLDELDRMLASGEATRDMDEYRKLSREHAELGPVVSLYQTWRQIRSDLCAGLDMLTDPEMRELAEAEVADARERLPECQGTPAGDRGRTAKTIAAEGHQGRSQCLS